MSENTTCQCIHHRLFDFFSSGNTLFTSGFVDDVMFTPTHNGHTCKRDSMDDANRAWLIRGKVWYVRLLGLHIAVLSRMQSLNKPSLSYELFTLRECSLGDSPLDKKIVILASRYFYIGLWQYFVCIFYWYTVQSGKCNRPTREFIGNPNLNPNRVRMQKTITVSHFMLTRQAAKAYIRWYFENPLLLAPRTRSQTYESWNRMHGAFSATTERLVCNLSK